MHQTVIAAPDSRAKLWSGRILTALPVLFLLFDSVIKLIRIDPVVESFLKLGYNPDLSLAIGILELACVALFVSPATSVLGAVLLTGYLGGAVATHVRAGSPLATHTLFPVYVAALIWLGLFLREDRLRALLPIRRRR